MERNCNPLNIIIPYAGHFIEQPSVHELVGTLQNSRGSDGQGLLSWLVDEKAGRWLFETLQSRPVYDEAKGKNPI